MTASRSAAVLFFVCPLLLAIRVFASSTNITIGIVSDGMPLTEEMALNFSFHYANTVLLSNSSLQLVPLLASPVQSEFTAIRTACALLHAGVSSLLAVGRSSTIRGVSMIASQYHVPLLAPRTTYPLFASASTYPYLLRQSPPDSLQSEAMADLIHSLYWKRLAILTSNSQDGVVALVRLHTIAVKRKWTIYPVQPFHSSNNGTTVDARPSLVSIKSRGARIIVLHCTAVEGLQVLLQAADLGMTTAGWQWIVTHQIASSDILLQSVEAIARLQGLLGLTIGMESSSLFQHVNRQWMEQTGEQSLSSSQAVIMDAVFSIAYSYDGFESTLQAEVIDCVRPSPLWSRGAEAFQRLEHASGDGVAGPIEYEFQQPKSTLFDIVTLTGSQWQKIGDWRTDRHPDRRLSMTNSTFRKMGGAKTVSDTVSQLANKTLRVVCILSDAFTVPKDGLTPKYINSLGEVPIELLQGFNVDLLLKLQQLIGFNSSIYMVPDNVYGVQDSETGLWNGLVGELVEGRAEMISTDLAVTANRRKYIDYTVSYYDASLKFILKPRVRTQDPFGFFSVFSVSLWIYIVVTLVLVAIVISLLTKLSPYDHHGGFIQENHQSHSDWQKHKRYLMAKKKSMSSLDVANSLWMAVSVLMQQGAEVFPLSTPGRISTSLWFLLSMLFISTYTASFSALLTQSHLQGDITTLEELATQTQIQFGVTKQGSMASFFEESTVPLYKKMFYRMMETDSQVDDYNAGIRRVRAGGYAYIQEESLLTYEAQKAPCGLKVLGKAFDTHGKAFAFRKNSPYTEELSLHMLQLKEHGFMEMLKQKWLSVPNGCGSDDNEASQDALNRLGVSSMIGVFYIIYAGLALAFVVLLFEWIFACASDVIHRDIIAHHPTTFLEAFRWRRKMLRQYIFKDVQSSRCCVSSLRSEPIHAGDCKQPSSRKEPTEGSYFRGIELDAIRGVSLG